MTENLRLKITEGQAIEISDGSMWTPTNYDGSTIGVTTFTAADAATLRTRVENGGWRCTSPSDKNCNDVVRSFDTAGSSSFNICDPSDSGGADKIPGTEQCHETATTSDGDIQKIGVYYNYYTATAGRGTLETTETILTSLCPKGWVLPGMFTTIARYRTSYQDLFTYTYGIELSSDSSISGDVRIFPFSMIQGGSFQPDNASPIRQRYRGDYMSRNVSNATNYRHLAVREGSVNSETARKRMGDTIRCVFYPEY